MILAQESMGRKKIIDPGGGHLHWPGHSQGLLCQKKLAIGLSDSLWKEMGTRVDQVICRFG